MGKLALGFGAPFLCACPTQPWRQNSGHRCYIDSLAMCLTKWFFRECSACMFGCTSITSESPASRQTCWSTIPWNLVKCWARLFLLAKPRFHTVHFYSDSSANIFLLLFPFLHNYMCLFMWHLFMKPLLQNWQVCRGWPQCMVFLCL